MLTMRAFPVGKDANNIAVMPMRQKAEIVAVINKRPDLSQLRGSGFLSDITLEIAGGKRYPVHKNILAVSSEYFKTLFSGRFRQSTMIKLDDVSSSTLDLYLDMIYGKELIIYNWREVMKLLEFAKFTQTDIPGQDNIIKHIIVSPEDFVPYIQALSDFYDNEIPIEIIAYIDIPWYDTTMNAFYIDGIKFSDLGEYFTKALIETRKSGDIKYLIAQKAVSEGMSTDLYGFVQAEKIRGLPITPESLPYLRRIDMNLLTASTDVVYGREFIVSIDKYMGIDGTIYNDKYMIFTGKTKDDKRAILAIPVRQSDENDEEKYVAISKDGTEQDIDENLAATIIKVKEFYSDTLLDNTMHHYGRPGDIGPLFVDKYELL